MQNLHHNLTFEKRATEIKNLGNKILQKLEQKDNSPRNCLTSDEKKRRTLK